MKTSPRHRRGCRLFLSRGSVWCISFFHLCPLTNPSETLLEGTLLGATALLYMPSSTRSEKWSRKRVKIERRKATSLQRILQNYTLDISIYFFGLGRKRSAEILKLFTKFFFHLKTYLMWYADVDIPGSCFPSAIPPRSAPGSPGPSWTSTGRRCNRSCLWSRTCSSCMA